MEGKPSRGVDRREFVKAAVAIGGTSALAACVNQERNLTETETTETETETATTETVTRLADIGLPTGGGSGQLPSRQHEWNEYLVKNAHGNTALPNHQTVLGLSYEGSIPPTEAERQQVEDVMDMLERAFQYGTGGDPSASINEGLLSLLGYAPRYFETVGDPVSLMKPADVLSAVGEDPSKTDGFDAILVLNSDFGSVVTAAENVLFGEYQHDTINGVDVEATFEGVFSRAGRRTGVVGRGLPAEKLDNDDVPEDAPLSMGFASGFADNQSPEDPITIQDGPFAGGTTMQSSRIHIDLDRWYEHNTQERVDRMFCPAHDADDVGETAEKLGQESEITQDDVDNIPAHAADKGVLGHSQKVATARDDDFEPRILRRTEGIATDVPDGSALNFQSIQRSMDAFVDARKAMSIDEYDVDVADEDHGIIDFLETKARGTYIVPPRGMRALPRVTQ